MSHIAGMICEDGAVIGAIDCAPASTIAAGVAAAGTTFEVTRDLILAGTGRIGLGQRFAQVLAAVRSDSRFGQWEALRAARTICAEAVEDFKSTGSQLGEFAALVAFPSPEGCQLCEFAADLQPELKTPARPFACLGEGRSAGESFLHFFHRTLLAQSLPRPAEALFVVTWTLLTISAVEPGVAAAALRRGQGRQEWGKTGSAEPVAAAAVLRLAVLGREGPEMPPAVCALTPQQVSAQLERVRAAEKHLAKFRKRLVDGY